MARISNRLTKFIASEEDDFESPFTDNKEDEEESISSDTTTLSLRRASKLEDLDEIVKGREKKKKKSLFERIIDDGAKLEEELYDDESVEALDRYLTEFAIDDEDIELRNSLIAKGRKYSRETKVSAESSEITKAFSGTEKMLNEMLEQVATDIDLVQKDITQMRSMRTGRNNKVLADMINNKKELYGVRMNAIKEINSIRKAQFDIKSKMDKNKPINDEGSDMLVNQAIGSLLGTGRSNAMSIIGGYSNVSGAIGADEDYIDEYNSEETEEVTYEDDNYDAEKEEGRKYLKYEGRGVELVLTEHEDGSYEVTAEDRDGVQIDDYPIPSHIQSLQFSVNERLGSATDDYNRKYKYRRDYGEE